MRCLPFGLGPSRHRVFLLYLRPERGRTSQILVPVFGVRVPVHQRFPCFPRSKCSLFALCDAVCLFFSFLLFFFYVVPAYWPLIWTVSWSPRHGLPHFVCRSIFILGIGLDLILCTISLVLLTPRWWRSGTKFWGIRMIFLSVSSFLLTCSSVRRRSALTLAHFLSTLW